MTAVLHGLEPLQMTEFNLGVFAFEEFRKILVFFEEIDLKWGDFDNYVRQGLELSDSDVMQLRSQLLE